MKHLDPAHLLDVGVHAECPIKENPSAENSFCFSTLIRQPRLVFLLSARMEICIALPKPVAGTWLYYGAVPVSTAARHPRAAGRAHGTSSFRHVGAEDRQLFTAVQKQKTGSCLILHFRPL